MRQVRAHPSSACRSPQAAPELDVARVLTIAGERACLARLGGTTPTMPPSQSRQVSYQDSTAHLPSRRTTDSGRRIAAFLPALLALLSVAFPAARSEAPVSRHVVLISLDGFPASALADPLTPVPTLQRLGREGAVAKALLPVNPA